MLKEHKNHWLNLIKKRIDPSRFYVSNIGDNEFRINYENSPLIFIIKQAQSTFDYFNVRYTQFRPKFPFRYIGSNYKFPRRMESLKVEDVDRRLNDWISVVKRYILEETTPDLWAQFGNFSDFTNTSRIIDEDYKPFTENQRRLLKEGLNKFNKLIVENYKPTEDQLDFISQRLGYLKEAVDRLNRFDWKSLAFSIVTSIAVNLTVDTEGGRMLFKLFQQALDSVLKLLLR